MKLLLSYGHMTGERMKLLLSYGHMTGERMKLLLSYGHMTGERMKLLIIPYNFKTLLKVIGLCCRILPCQHPPDHGHRRFENHTPDEGFLYSYTMAFFHSIEHPIRLGPDAR